MNKKVIIITIIVALILFSVWFFFLRKKWRKKFKYTSHADNKRYILVKNKDIKGFDVFLEADNSRAGTIYLAGGVVVFKDVNGKVVEVENSKDKKFFSKLIKEEIEGSKGVSYGQNGKGQDNRTKEEKMRDAWLKDPYWNLQNYKPKL